MSLSSLLMRVGRRAVVTLGVMTVFAASIANAQTTPAAPAAPQADPLKFTADTVIMIFQVKPDKTADFESGFADMRGLMAGSTIDDMKALNASMTLYKVDIPNTPLYIVYGNPVMKTMSYDLTKILYFTTPPAADAPAGSQPTPAFKRDVVDAIYAKLSGAIDKINPWPLKKIGG